MPIFTYNDKLIALVSDSEAAGVVTAWVAGGAAGTEAAVTCRITTNQGRTDDRTIYFDVIER